MAATLESFPAPSIIAPFYYSFFPLNTVLLSSAYLPPIQYFARLYAADQILAERCDHYVKQTYRNRTVIASSNGPLALTIPIVRTGENNQSMRDLRISDHGRWHRLHWTALVSAYEQSPYFPYYEDDFRHFYEEPYEYLIDFNDALQAKICELLMLTPDIRPTTEYVKTPAPEIEDCRDLIRPKVSFSEDARFRIVPYYQVFQSRLGFLPNLSIVDLLFNMGPESRLVLKKSLV